MPKKDKKKLEIVEASFLTKVSRHGSGYGVAIPSTHEDKFPHKEQVWVTIQLVDETFKEKMWDEIDEDIKSEP